MLSRVANSLYWMSRYMERCDGILRLLRVNYAYSQDEFDQFSWRPVLLIFSEMEPSEIETIKYEGRKALQFMVTDKFNKNSVFNLVSKSRENARSVQDNVTKELWQCLNDYYHKVRQSPLSPALQNDDPVSVIDDLVQQGMHYYGTCEITMARNKGYYFMNIGKYLERAIQSVDILNVKFSELNYSLEERSDPTYWKYLLLSISGYELFLKSYRSALDSRNILHQIVWNEHFPRSITYSIRRLKQSFETLKSDTNSESYKALSFMIGKLESHIKYSDIKDLEEVGLKEYLHQIKQELLAIGNALNHYYFAFN
ncbi:MAG: alpha-E domain-containing protein [Bacteroidetes bacterium]|nr:alpha-E domain-containing protein [Pseudopedobacter sp.]MBU0695611.1 alpha-E domain-containing protein [Bacteroidota bacterium]MBU1373469.1 alpha-E domain-containing protein [Bacteroidota bacterium]MBU1485227.1 alpha-E domain-containing protein [Bacteroidota bacterium]MBU1759381.1 alpha-E domain-containing protein [Bacteroidota bacterium]